MRIHAALYALAACGFVGWLFVLAYLAFCPMLLAFLGVTALFAGLANRFDINFRVWISILTLIGWVAVGALCAALDVPRHPAVALNATAQEVEVLKQDGTAIELYPTKLNLICIAGRGLTMAAPDVKIEINGTAIDSLRGAPRGPIVVRATEDQVMSLFLDLPRPQEAIVRLRPKPASPARLVWESASNGSGLLNIPTEWIEAAEIGTSAFDMEVRGATIKFDGREIRISEEKAERIVGNLLPTSDGHSSIVIAFEGTRHSDSEIVDFVFRPGEGSPIAVFEQLSGASEFIQFRSAGGQLKVGSESIKLSDYIPPPKVRVGKFSGQMDWSLGTHGFQSTANGNAKSVRIDGKELVHGYFFLLVWALGSVVVIVLTAGLKKIGGEWMSKLFKKVTGSS